MELLIGCGNSREKRLVLKESPGWTKLVTLDINPAHNPDVVHNLEVLPLPFADDTFDEIHAYEVLEHVGRQGDYRFFFDQWSEFWRILKPQGFLGGTSPVATCEWAWGDPGHTRIVSKENFVFLSQDQYQRQIGNTPMTDYRFCYKADFEPAYIHTNGNTFIYALEAVKPSRYKPNGHA